LIDILGNCLRIAIYLGISLPEAMTKFLTSVETPRESKVSSKGAADLSKNMEANLKIFIVICLNSINMFVLSLELL
jgi:hypothetical protein